MGDIKSPVLGWTDAKFRGWIISLLRRGTLRFPPRNEVLRAARVGKKLNEKSGRMCEHYKCSGCLGEFPLKEVSMDHIEPTVEPDKGFIDWNTYIDRMFCPIENWQCLCSTCHGVKTDKEKTQRKSK